MSAHDLPKNICPYCLKSFDTRQGVQAHQKAKGHRVIDKEDGAAERKRAARIENESRRDARRARAQADNL
jgi:hypothetical protein